MGQIKKQLGAKSLTGEEAHALDKPTLDLSCQLSC